MDERNSKFMKCYLLIYLILFTVYNIKVKIIGRVLDDVMNGDVDLK